MLKDLKLHLNQTIVSNLKSQARIETKVSPNKRKYEIPIATNPLKAITRNIGGKRRVRRSLTTTTIKRYPTR